VEGGEFGGGLHWSDFAYPPGGGCL
jgi:hypothetical protein